MMKNSLIKVNFYPKLKVCGLTDLGQIEELIGLNVDFLGFIFYEKSPRFVLNHLSLNDIKNINRGAKVGVFVNETVEEIEKIAEVAELNLIQLHGNETAEFIEKLKAILNPKIGIIKVLRIGDQPVEQLQTTINQQPTTINYFLFDTDSKAFGGTGKTFDWKILNKLKIPKPYFLSGGISEENFTEVEILNQKPFALDINSKFEISPGVKDVGRIERFVKLLNLKA